ncbi:MAG: cation transporter [Nannocystaceae bacterium]|nr:cation transporter [bacterium]
MQQTASEKTQTTWLRIPKMDCASEENLIRMALDATGAVEQLAFDLDDRTVAVVHRGAASVLLQRLEPLQLGATIERTEPGHCASLGEAPDAVGERRVLKQLLAINGAMFVAELGFGIVAGSTGLLADALDMLSDSMVYGLALAASGKSISRKRGAARFSGWLQMVLALGVAVEVVRRATGESLPEVGTMIGVSAVALAANLGCVVLLRKHRKGEVHLRASWIFTSTDAFANLGVIVAGAMVLWTGSKVPDLIVGSLIALIVGIAAVRIIGMSRAQEKPA